MFDINGAEILILLVLAIIVIGPERVPDYAQQLRAWVVRGRDYVKRGQSAVAEDLGGDVDWSRLDPRQYDPRHIVRDALLSDDAPPAVTTRATGPAASTASPPGATAPYDAEAT